MANRDIFKEISDRIAAQLEQGVKPWAKPWKDTGEAFRFDLPHNAITGKPYRGANVWFLMVIAQAKGYPTAQWLTFKAAKEAGGMVRKGEQGTPVFFWLFGEKLNAETGKTEKTVMVRQYTVFNIAQTENVKLPNRKPVELTEPERVAAAEKIVTETGAIINYGGNRAFYSPSVDQIQMPPRAAFKDTDGYYGTLFHELGHWTGHEARLNREFGKRFGDDAYAFEELVAELTAAFVCGATDIASTDREDHASYIQSWIRRMKDDPKAFITAAGKAQAAADYIMGKRAEQEEEQDTQQAA